MKEVKIVKGKIIILNGISSAGKTTLAKMLQDSLQEPYFWISVDAFFSMAPQKHLGEKPLETFENIRKAMYRSIAALSDADINTIVDIVLLHQFNMLEECINMLKDHQVLFVHVECPIEEIRRREKERGDREIGQAEAQISDLEPKDLYDATVDTYNESKEQCIKKIKYALQNKIGIVFDELSRNYKSQKEC